MMPQMLFHAIIPFFLAPERWRQIEYRRQSYQGRRLFCRTEKRWTLKVPLDVYEVIDTEQYLSTSDSAH